jgi:hypothetical protein
MYMFYEERCVRRITSAQHVRRRECMCIACALYNVKMASIHLVILLYEKNNSKICFTLLIFLKNIIPNFLCKNPSMHFSIGVCVR